MEPKMLEASSKRYRAQVVWSPLHMSHMSLKPYKLQLVLVYHSSDQLQEYRCAIEEE